MVAGLGALMLAGCSSETVQPESKSTDAPAQVAPVAAAPVAQPVVPPVRAKEQELAKAAFASLAPEARLGARLFFDNRLSNPGANLATSCRSCHVPPAVSGGKQQWTDSTPLSVMPANDRGGKLETNRNTPTLLDATKAGPYPSDGEYSTLDAYVSHKLASEHLGWRPDDADRAKLEIQALLAYDDGSDPLAEGTYAEQFQVVKSIEVETLTPDAAIAAVVASLTDYLRTVVTNNTAAYDAIIYLNRFPEGLAGEGDTPFDYSGRFFGRVANEEGRVLIRFPNIYNEDAYQGLKTFMRVMPTWNSSVVGEETNIGNCVACHVPPKFTDNKFHNMGVAQMEYDALHGEGAFAKLAPDAPSDKTNSRAVGSDPEKVDLGRWNIDADEQNVGAVKTPKLRNAGGTAPYMHNGAYVSLEDAIRQHITAADLARADKLRNPDPELV
jgi:cytochrome c peroxidase